MSEDPFVVIPYEEVCRNGPSPLYFDRVLKELLAEHFSDSTRIISPYLRNKIYSPDYTETQLRIEPYYVWTPESADQTPAIILTRGDWTPALNKLMGGYTIVSDSEAVAPMLWQGSHILNCVSSVPIESAELAFEVANFFISMRRPIERRLAVARLLVAKLTGTMPSQHVAELWETTIAVVYDFEKSFVVTKTT